jgi:hypothetical protein
MRVNTRALQVALALSVGLYTYSVINKENAINIQNLPNGVIVEINEDVKPIISKYVMTSESFLMRKKDETYLNGAFLIDDNRYFLPKKPGTPVIVRSSILPRFLSNDDKNAVINLYKINLFLDKPFNRDNCNNKLFNRDNCNDMQLLNFFYALDEYMMKFPFLKMNVYIVRDKYAAYYEVADKIFLSGDNKFIMLSFLHELGHALYDYFEIRKDLLPIKIKTIELFSKGARTDEFLFGFFGGHTEDFPSELFASSFAISFILTEQQIYDLFLQGKIISSLDKHGIKVSLDVLKETYYYLIEISEKLKITEELKAKLRRLGMPGFEPGSQPP